MATWRYQISLEGKFLISEWPSSGDPKSRNGRTVERWNGGTVERWNGGMVERWNGGTVERWNGGMVEWWNGGMVEWWNGFQASLAKKRLFH